MTSTAPLRSPQELYLDWERSHWAAQDVDLARDVEQWRAQNEVVADPAAIADHVARARDVLAQPFRVIFDDALGALTRRLKLIGVAL